MQQVVFTVRPSTTAERQHLLLQQLGSWPEIAHVSPLLPEATDPAIQRMCYAYLADHANAVEVVERLRAVPEVESADLPAQRRLI